MSTSTLDTRDADRGLRDVLHRVWGFSDFRPLQREAMDAILAARDSVVVLPTGGGKSLCFQAPALVNAGPEPNRPPPDAGGASRRGLAVVVSPLISLMKDQVDGLRVDGVAASYLNSTLQPRERDEVLASIRDDRCRLLYVSPERVLVDAGLRRLLQQAGLRFIAIDEAHCISQWGHDFRPEYRQLGGLRDEFPGVSFHAFTATATERVRRDIVAELRLRDPRVLVGSFDRPNLTYRVVRRTSVQRQLLQILTRHHGEAGIIYCGSRRDVESLAQRFRIMRAWPTMCAAAIRKRSWTSGRISWSRRSRLAWASIGQTFAMSCTPARPARRSITSRSRDAPDVTD
jgi:ATP-dependent DNA helicase RecQ